MRRFFIEKDQDRCLSGIIEGSDAKHIKTVLRLKPRDHIILIDGTGREYEAEISDFSPGKVHTVILRERPSSTESPARITVAQAFLKEKKMDKLIKPLTEIGIAVWQPFIAQRSVSKPDTRRLSSRMLRWEAIAKEALKQCERSRLPEICEPVSFNEILSLGGKYDLCIIFWERGPQKIDISQQKNNTAPRKILIVLGPEGGFTQNEIRKAQAMGFLAASLGPRILRAETAAIAASTLVQYLFGDMGKNNA